jgi:gamma-glutamyltranspeptidase/glutathione hydrolase
MPLRKQIATALLILLSQAQLVYDADLSPRLWKAEERKRIEQLESNPISSTARIVEGQSGLVAATMSPIAVHVGLEALEQGGTAADAAATVALTQVTTALGSYVSYAGILHLLYYEAKSGTVHSLNAGWNSYLAESDPATIPHADLGPLFGAAKPTEGAQGRKTLVPGFMAGVEAMHKRFGRLRFGELFEPAIWYAEHGVNISPLLAAYFGQRQKYLSRTEEGRRFMRQAGGNLPRAGARFVEPDLAKTLRAVSRRGAKYMYTGAWGQKFVEAVRREGGKASRADLTRYRPIWEEPLSTSFLGHTIFAPGRSNEGGYQILEALNLLEELKTNQKGPYWKDPQAFRDLSRVLPFVELGPAAISLPPLRGKGFSPEDRVTKAYAKAVAPVMSEARGESPASNSPHHSDAVVVVDRWGNIAALVHSINTALWGTTGIVVGGIPIPDAAGFQQVRLASIKPGDRVPNEIAPVIAMIGARPVLAIATIGSSLLPETVRLVFGTLGNQLDPQTIMAAPALLANFDPPKPGETPLQREQVVPEGAYGADFLERLEADGIKVRQTMRTRVLATRGTAVLGTIDWKNGRWQSVEIPGLVDFAASY